MRNFPDNRYYQQHYQHDFLLPFGWTSIPEPLMVGKDL